MLGLPKIKTFITEILFFGSHVNKLFNKSIQLTEKFWYKVGMLLYLLSTRSNNFFALSKVKNSGQILSFGHPIKLQINSYWFKSLFPYINLKFNHTGRRGLPSFSNSPKMHPIAHMSLAQEYMPQSNKISGGRYHKVTTFGVYFCSGTP
jgi:hypothetical protein